MRFFHASIWHRRDSLQFRPWTGSWHDGLPTLFNEELEAYVRDVAEGWADNPARVQDFAAVIDTFRQRDRQLAEVYVAAMQPPQHKYEAREAAHLMNQQWVTLSRYLTRQVHDQRYPNRDTPVPWVLIVIVSVCVAAWLTLVLIKGLR